MRNPGLFGFLLLLLGTAVEFSNGFSTAPTTTRRVSLLSAPTVPLLTQLTAKSDPEEETVKVGSEEYYKGFLSRSLEEEPVERVTGDALLGPTFKFVGGFAVVLAALTVGFLASNGLL